MKIFDTEEMINKTFRLPLKLVEQLYIVAQNKGVSLMTKLSSIAWKCCQSATK